MRRWQIAAVLLLCLALTGSTACQLFGGGDEEVSRQQFTVRRGDLTVSVNGSGNIAVSDEARLAFDSGGKVEKILVERGDKVSKGNVLARLDTDALDLSLTQAEVALIQAQAGRSQAQASLAQAQASLEQAEYTLNRLVVVEHASQDRIDVAEAQLEAAKLQLEAAKLQLEVTELGIKSSEQALEKAQKQLEGATITAPFDGLVVGVYAREGDIIPSPTMGPKVVIYLIDPSSLELTVEVDEIDIPDVKLGQKVVISLDALPGEQFDGVVTLIGSLPAVEAGLVLYEVKIGFDVSPDSGLRIGMSATADIIVEERSNVLLVPDRVIERDSQGHAVVRVMVNEQIEERSVVTGISDGLDTEIVSGLWEGETVVIERQARPSEPGFLF